MMVRLSHRILSTGGFRLLFYFCFFKFWPNFALGMKLEAGSGVGFQKEKFDF